MKFFGFWGNWKINFRGVFWGVIFGFLLVQAWYCWNLFQWKSNCAKFSIVGPHRCFESWNQSISDQPHSWLKSLNDLNFYPSNHIILWIVPFFSVMKQRSLRLHFLPKVNSTCHLNLKFKVSEWNSTDF